MSSLNLLTPPTTPDDEWSDPKIGLELLSFNEYQSIEFRGRATSDCILVKVKDLIEYFNLDSQYMRTVNSHLVTCSLRDLYVQDFSSITGASNHSSLFEEYSGSFELYIKYKGIDILAHNVPVLEPFRDWLDTILGIDMLQCFEEINYDALGW